MIGVEVWLAIGFDNNESAFKVFRGFPLNKSKSYGEN